MHGFYRRCVTCMVPTGRACVLQEVCDVHGSYRACMGPTGGVIRV